MALYGHSQGSLRPYWFFLRPTESIFCEELWDGISGFYRPYPRRLESLTFADVVTKAALSPQLF